MLVIPESISIQLIDSNGNPNQIENVMISIYAKATHNDTLILGPLMTNTNGQINIDKKGILENINRFSPQEEIIPKCDSKVTIHLPDPEIIEGVFNLWNGKLRLFDEKKDNLKKSDYPEDTYEYSVIDYTEKHGSAVNKLLLNNSISELNDIWDGKKSHYSYQIEVSLR